MRTWLAAGLTAWAFLASAAGATEEAPTFRTRVGAGMFVSPNLFAISASAEGYVDDHFSLGPTIQMGIGDSRRILIPVLMGRLTQVIPTMKELEFSLFGGAGLMNRRGPGYSFNDFNAQFGAGLDYLVMTDMRVGFSGFLNITSSQIERFVNGAVVTASYSF